MLPTNIAHMLHIASLKCSTGSLSRSLHELSQATRRGEGDHDMLAALVEIAEMYDKKGAIALNRIVDNLISEEGLLF